MCDGGTPRMTDRRTEQNEADIDWGKSQKHFTLMKFTLYAQVIHHERKMLSVVGFIVKTAGQNE